MRYQEFKLSEYTDLNSEKKAIIAKIRASSAEDPEQAKILDKIWKILNTGQISQNIDNAFNASIDDETEFSGGELATVKKEVAQIVASVETDYGTLSKFVARLGTGGVVSINALKKPAATFLEVFGDQSAILAFNALARYGVGKKQKGPGEYALACLSNQIKLAAGEGDLEITGMGKVELKTAMSKSGGRIGYGGGSQKNKISVLELYRERIPTIMQTVAKNAKGGSLGFQVS